MKDYRPYWQLYHEIHKTRRLARARWRYWNVTRDKILKIRKKHYQAHKRDYDVRLRWRASADAMITDARA